MGRIKSIMKAAADGDIETVRKHISNGTDIDYINRDGYTALHYAARYGHVDLIIFLLEHGANIDIHINTNDAPIVTPIELACIYDQLESVKLLTSRGCSLDNCICHYAASMNHYDILEFLINNGVGLNIQDYSGRTPLHWAVQENYFDIVKLLVQNHADINAKDEYGQTPLYESADVEHMEISKYLMENGAIVDLAENTTPFGIACAFNEYETAQYLFSVGADINYKDKEQRTALFYAKVKNDSHLIHYLLSHGAITDIIDIYGTSISDLDNETIRKKLYMELFQ